MNEIIDLHTHSSASDGTLSPAALVRHAKAAGLSAIALTDHDTTAGLSEAIAAAEEEALELIPGIELSADFETEMHILGYFIDPNSPALLKEIQELKRFRAERNRTMIARLRELGFDLTEEFILSETGAAATESLGRVHMARAMVAKGYVSSINEGFEKYLRSGKAGYCARQRLSPQDCIELIRKSGGVAVLAHPVLLKMEADKLDSLLAELAGYGLAGLECYYITHDEAHTELYLSLAERHGLIATGGSDFHGENKPDIAIGHIYGDNRIPYEILTKLKERA